MPDAELMAQWRQQRALGQLQRRLEQEQAAFDEGDDMHAQYQTQLDAVQSKQAAIVAAQEAARERRTSPPRPLPPILQAPG